MRSKIGFYHTFCTLGFWVFHSFHTPLTKVIASFSFFLFWHLLDVPVTTLALVLFTRIMYIIFMRHIHYRSVLSWFRQLTGDLEIFSKIEGDPEHISE